jgi:hypothetical protein
MTSREAFEAFYGNTFFGECVGPQGAWKYSYSAHRSWRVWQARQPEIDALKKQVQELCVESGGDSVAHQKHIDAKDTEIAALKALRITAESVAEFEQVAKLRAVLVEARDALRVANKYIDCSAPWDDAVAKQQKALASINAIIDGDKNG